MKSSAQSSIPQRQWRWMSRLFLSLLPILMIFHLVMWSGFTRTLFRPETGDLKRIGYLVGLEDCKAKLVSEEPPGSNVVGFEKMNQTPQVTTVIFGDSFSASLAKAYGARTGQPGGLVAVNWDSGNGVAEIENWVRDGWFRKHGVKSIVVERVEYAWLDTFADKGSASPADSWNHELSGEIPSLYQRAGQWTFANNGNYKVVLSNLAYLFSPTAFKLTDTGVVRLQKKFFNCSYGDRLLFYREDSKGALTSTNQPQLERALKHLQELADTCHQQGLQFHLIIPPVKSYLYYDWVKYPFYPDSKLLETMQTRAKASGYVDLKQAFHQKLVDGFQDLYYPDDAHWNYPAAQIAADELIHAEASP